MDIGTTISFLFPFFFFFTEEDEEVEHFLSTKGTSIMTMIMMMMPIMIRNIKINDQDVSIIHMSPEAMLTTERREVQNDHRLPLSQYLRGSQEVVQIITDYRSELTAQNCARRKLDTNSSLS